MHYYACYFVLATMNYNCFKDFMEKRHYINKKKSLHAGHVWYNYFFFFFSFGLEMDIRRLMALAFILLFYCLILIKFTINTITTNYAYIQRII